MDKGNMNYVVFLDIRKAFDRINHQSLTEKLSCYGMKGDELLFFRSYLQDRTQCCSVNGHTSTLRRIMWCATRLILGPLLFMIYINDLPSFVKDVNVTMYADDTSLDKAFRSPQQLKGEMIPAFSGVCKSLQTNKLSLNTVQTELMIIGTSRRLS